MKRTPQKHLLGSASLRVFSERPFDALTLLGGQNYNRRGFGGEFQREAHFFGRT